MLNYVVGRIRFITRGARFVTSKGKRTLIKPRGIELPSNFRIGYSSLISIYQGGKIKFGNNCGVCSNATVSAVGGEIIVGDNVTIGDNCWVTGQGGGIYWE